MPATATGYETLQVETTDRICTITLDRPDVYNAVNDQVTTDLQAALKAASRDRDVAVVILTGAGKAFCSGQDLGVLKERYVPGHTPHLGDDLRRRYNPVITLICGMDKPVIAAVNGVAAGAGCSFALACDLRVASDKASFIEVFINVGLIPDSASTWTLPRLVGLGKAMELCCTGDKIDAAEALRIGLVNRVVPADELMDETRTLAKRLASLPARGIALTKRLLQQSFDNDLAAQLEAEAFAQETAGLTEDHTEGVVAFIEKRKPKFVGRQGAMTTRTTVGILGAGTMGAGIAQVAATSGWTVALMDVDPATVESSIAGIAGRLDRLVEKGRLSASERDAARSRLTVASSPTDLRDCALVVEAIVEDLDVKADVLRRLVPALRPDAIIATNTSSLSVTAIGAAIGEGRRTVGMHFFNPAPIMKLVEVVAGDASDPAVVDRVASIATSWGKTVARAADVPGFIVNHVARPYYLEAFRILEDGLAGPREIDDAMTTLGGFRMGPLELTDLIGQDVNTATTRSVWEALERPPLLAPSVLQERLVAEGHLGRKSGRGVYVYNGEPVPAIEPRRAATSFRPSGDLDAAVASFVETAAGDPGAGDGLARLVFARILVAIIVQAAHAHRRGVAGPGDIDTALRYGTNYPKGPFEWAGAIGHDRCVRLLQALGESVSDDRFAVPESFAVTGPASS